MYKNPYDDLTNGRWIKVNFHTHAGTGEGTCGSNPVDAVVRLYRDLNYGALCISNHDLYTDTTAFDDGKLHLIQGVEYSPYPHMLTIGVDRSLHELPHQAAIDATAEAGGFTILCHPNWIHKAYWSPEQINALTGFVGLEVMNTLIYRLSGSGRATDVWDAVLKQGRLIWGFGSDDFHIPSDAGRCWTDVYVKAEGFEGIKQAVTAGRLTASTGLALDYLRLDGKTITVKAKFPTETYVDTFDYRFATENGAVAQSQGPSAEYTIGDENYVRVEVIAENGAMLFTQPVIRTEFYMPASH